MHEEMNLLSIEISSAADRPSGLKFPVSMLVMSCVDTPRDFQAVVTGFGRGRFLKSNTPVNAHYSWLNSSLHSTRVFSLLAHSFYLSHCFLGSISCDLAHAAPSTIDDVWLRHIPVQRRPGNIDCEGGSGSYRRFVSAFLVVEAV